MPALHMKALAVSLALAAGAFAAKPARAVCAEEGVALLGDSFPVNEAGVGAGSARAAWNEDRGEYLVVWAFYDGGHRLYGQRIAADGSPVGANFEITSDPNAIIEPAVAAAPGHDEFLVAWQTQSDPFNGARGMLLAGDGAAASDVFVISADGSEPELVYVAATEEFVFSGRGAGVVAQRIGLDGALVGGPVTLATIDDGAPAPNGQMAANAAGQVLSLWRNQVDETLQGRRIAPDGQPSGGIATYSSDFPTTGRAAYSDYRPATDDYVALYNVAQSGAVKWFRVDASGTGTAPQTVATESNEISALAVARDDGTRDTMFIWSDYDEISGSSTLSARLLSADDALIGAPTPLSTSPNSLFTLAPARARGEALLTWQGSDVLGQRLVYGCLRQDEIFADGFE